MSIIIKMVHHLLLNYPIIFKIGKIMNQKLKLIFAEDEIETRKNIVSYINNNYDLDIIEVSNGNEAWAAYLKYQPDILITDLSMPEMDGIGLITKIRNVDEILKIIVISAHSEDDKLKEAMNLKLFDYHVKPLKRRVLLNSLDSVINSLCEVQDSI